MSRVLLRSFFGAALFLFFALPAQAREPWGEGLSVAEDLEISLVTFGPGDDVPSYFAHTALWVKDRLQNVEFLYNFGMFSFDETMVPKFLMGRLEFMVGRANPARTFRFYQSLNRSVRYQRLDLSPNQRMMIAQALADIVLPENRVYLYDHYYDNCATRIRDLIDTATNGALARYAKARPSMTLREHTRRHGQQNPPLDWGMYLGLNDSVDQPITQWEAMFLPEVMEAVIDEVQLEDAFGGLKPLVSKKVTVFEAKGRAAVPDEPDAAVYVYAFLGLLLSGVTVLLARRTINIVGRPVAYGLWVMVLSGVFALLAFLLSALQFTDHLVSHYNENLLQLSPLWILGGILAPLVLLWPSKFASVNAYLWRGAQALAVLGLMLKPLPSFDQSNTMVWVLTLPVVFALAYGAGLLKRSYERE